MLQTGGDKVTEQEKLLHETLNVLKKEKLTPYIILVGSWAEYCYKDILSENYSPNIKTRDLDLIYMNIRTPGEKIDISSGLKDLGYETKQDLLSGVTKYSGKDLEIEFLTRLMGSGESPTNTIESLGIKSEGLRNLDILIDNTIIHNLQGIDVFIPKPEAYVVHKLVINKSRLPKEKREKDILSCKKIIDAIKDSPVRIASLNDIIASLSKKQRNLFVDTVKQYSIKIPNNEIRFEANSFSRNSSKITDELNLNFDKIVALKEQAESTQKSILDIQIENKEK